MLLDRGGLQTKDLEPRLGLREGLLSSFNSVSFMALDPYLTCFKAILFSCLSENPGFQIHDKDLLNWSLNK